MKMSDNNIISEKLPDTPAKKNSFINVRRTFLNSKIISIKKFKI